MELLTYRQQSFKLQIYNNTINECTEQAHSYHIIPILCVCISVRCHKVNIVFVKKKDVINIIGPPVGPTNVKAAAQPSSFTF